MNVSMRRLGLLGCTALAALVWGRGAVHAQPIPIGPVVNPGIGPARAVGGIGTNFALSPFSGAGAPLNAAGLPMNGLGLGFRGAAGLGIRGAGLGYGSLAASYANPLGYGALLRGGGLIGTAARGAALGYGLSYGAGMYGTQWMMNPYQGYLSGAASLTNANANYWRTIANARLVRQQALQEKIRTRRAWLEEAEYERAHMPDPEKIRQRALERELDRARVSPPLTEVWSGRSLNALLRNAMAQQHPGSAPGPSVPLSEDTLKSINLTSGDTRGNIGLLKDRGDLHWPQALQGESFKNARQEMTRRMKQAFRSVQNNNEAESSTINDLQSDLKNMKETLDANINKMTPDEYTDANRYVKLLGDTITALKDRNVSNYVNGTWTARGKNVAELVQHMRDQGLWFAPATPSDRSAYTALYYALAAFEAGLPRNGGSSNSGDNGGANPR